VNIFLINHYAGSPETGMEYRPYYLAQEWIKAGHRVTILAANYSHLRKKNPQFQSDIKEEIIDNITYIWINTPKYKGNGIARTNNMFTFIKKTLFKASYFVKKYKPDVVIASSTYPSDNYVARKMAKLSGAKYIYEVHDLWPLSPMELGKMSKAHPFIIAMQHAENFAYRKADAIISILPNTKAYMVSKGFPEKKWFHIPNGININEWEKSDKTLPADYQYFFDQIKHKTIIGYTGGHAISNSLDTLIKTANILKDKNNIVFVLVGNGNEKKNLKQQAKKLNNVFFLDPLPKKNIPALLNKMDILFIGWNKSPLYRFGISPNKIFDYMMAGKPIIHAVNAPNTFIKEANCGIAVEAENPKAIATAIIQLINTSARQLKEMGDRGKKYTIENFNYQILAKQFIDIIQKL